MALPEFVVIVIFAILGKHACESSISEAIRSNPTPLWNATYMDKLRNDLLTNYDKYAKPGEHYDVTTVKIKLIIRHLETDELNSTISVATWVKMKWTDPKLQWNPKDYGGMKSIKMADHEIWQPDIYLFNSANTGGEAITRYGNPHAIVISTGDVIWKPPIKFTALCEFNLRYWPFDSQHCYLMFGSWTRSAREIELKLWGGSTIDYENAISLNAWEIRHAAEIVSDSREFFSDTFYQARFNLTLTRKTSPYVAVVVTPIIAMVSLILLQFWLPPQGGQRIILSCFTMVMIAMLLSNFSQKLPGMGLNLPWIVLFYSSSLYIASFSLIEAIFIMLLLKPKEKQTLPWIVKGHLQGRLGKLLLLEHYASESGSGNSQIAEEMKDYHHTEFEDRLEGNEVIIKSTPESRIQREWEILALGIDRAFFVTYSFVYVVLFFVYII